MKKILALILSVVMLLSVMPVAYAERATFSPEVEEFLELRVKLFILRNGNIYEDGKSYRDISSFMESYKKADNEFDSYGYCDKYHNAYEVGAPVYYELQDSEFLETVPVFTRIYQPVCDMYEELVANGEIIVVVDTYEFYKLYFELWDHYDPNAEFNYINYDKYSEVLSEADIGSDQCLSATTQAEFDAGLEKIKPYYDLLINCLNGNHPYGEYISNNDATEEADGTKTATCDFCGATDTVVDEGSQLVKEPASFFEMLIALIKAFFEKIFSIFG
ncbi:MAG: hypothetical protein IJN88_04385 [Clostridia bacterium]|nr:hypothetical protein [Clostridia bacterium]